MKQHKFKTGQTVTIITDRASATPKGRFAIVRLLPTERGIHQYRIKSVFDGHERVVMESELD